MKRTLFLIAGIVLVAIGVAGVILPVLPGAPFLLLGLFCVAESHPRLHAWIMKFPLARSAHEKLHEKFPHWFRK